MTMQEVLELIRMNGILYKQSERPLTDAEMAAMGNVWLYHFKDYPAEAVKRAFLAANAVCTFPIQPADIFVQLKTASAQALPSESELWQQTQKAARQIEQESYWAATGGIVTGSGKLTPTHLREHVWQVFKSLPQRTGGADVQATGGGHAVCPAILCQGGKGRPAPGAGFAAGSSAA